MKNHYKVICEYCKKEFWRHNRLQKKYINKSRKKHGIKCLKIYEFCSKECSYAYKDKKIDLKCGWCNASLKQTLAEYKKSKSGFAFCNRSCSVSYNNTQRRKSKRSKCEIMLFDLIQQHYPNLNVLPNDKNLLEGFEVDIAIPELNLAIEWNGIVHYKPIYGEEKLDKIKSVDIKKQLLAQKNNIRLIVISDLVSTKAFVNEAFMNIVKIVDELLSYR